MRRVVSLQMPCQAKGGVLSYYREQRGIEKKGMKNK